MRCTICPLRYLLKFWNYRELRLQWLRLQWQSATLSVFLVPKGPSHTMKIIGYCDNQLQGHFCQSHQCHFNRSSLYQPTKHGDLSVCARDLCSFRMAPFLAWTTSGLAAVQRRVWSLSKRASMYDVHQTYGLLDPLRKFMLFVCKF